MASRLLFGFCTLLRLPSPGRPSCSFPSLLHRRASMDGICRRSTSSSSNSSLALRLWQANKSQAFLALYHPFVVSLASGILNIEAFRHYVSQDAFFLKAFASAYRLAHENVDDDISKVSINQLLHAIDNELRLHTSYAQAWGIDLTKETKPDDATVKYTDFLLATASGKEVIMEHSEARPGVRTERQKLVALTIVAMTPCMRLYSFLGQEIAKTGSYASVYRDWVDSYSSKSFQASTQLIEDLLDNLAKYLEEEDIQQAERLYSEALNLELEFFSSQPYNNSAFVPFIRAGINSSISSYLLMTDFDLTCTMTDSCSVLADVSIKSATNKGMEHGSKIRQTWEYLKRSYGKQYASIINLLKNSVKAVGDENHSRLRAFLKQLSEFEMQSNCELIDKGVLQGLDIEEIKSAGAQIPLQEGCSDFFKGMSKYSKVKIHVVSVCWSKTLIESTLLKGGMNFIEVHSNELCLGEQHTSGDIIRVLETPFDKERVLQEITENADADQPSPSFTIFIGDSVTDLLCMLTCDLGIVIGSNSSLEKVAHTFGISIIPLYKITLEKSKLLGGWQKTKGVLYKVSSWYELYAFMIGLIDA